MDFNQYILKRNYENVKGLGDRLAFMKEQINWEPFRPLISQVFYDDDVKGGRPHTDEIIVVRAMLLQAWYGLSDQDLEFCAYDRLSFQNFLDFPKSIPDFSTIWKIRERLKDKGIDTLIWHEVQVQLDEKGYVVKKGVIQDAAFIEGDFGKKRHYKEKKAEKHGTPIEYSEMQKNHMDKDGSFAVKNNQIHFGYKIHTKPDVDYGFIREYDVTTASMHDNNIDLVDAKDTAAYRDKGYSGKELKAKNVNDMTMKKAARGHPLTDAEKEYNRGISKVRAPGERPYSVIKRVFNGGRTYVKTLERFSIKEMFVCFAFNIYNLFTQEKKRLASAL
jgi:transposase, IS5 family